MKGKMELSNHELVTISAYALGGDSRYVNSEDVAIEVDRLAPGRFTWKRHPEQIDLGVVRWALQDAVKPSKGPLLVGSERKGWLLTEVGLAFVKCHSVGLAPLVDRRPRFSKKELHQQQGERLRMLSTDAYAKFERAGPTGVTVKEAEAFFRIDDYVAGAARESKLLRSLNLFGEDAELGRAVKALAEIVREGSGK